MSKPLSQKRTTLVSALVCILCVSPLSACTNSNMAKSITTNSPGAPLSVATGSGSIGSVDPSARELFELTNMHEKMLDDGWWFGEYPRIFKTAYAGASPQLKASFAADYANMLKEHNQDLVANWDSYVTYTKRSDFADAWWQKHDDSGRYAKLDRKMHVLWIHEALMDGSELWWRAYEQHNEANLQTAQALAHDEEQKKVFNYIDQEGRPRSLSDLVAQQKESTIH